MKTKIEWADDTENAASGCSEAVLPSGKMDPACVNCYARLQSARCASMGMALYDGVAERTGNAARWSGVFRWDRDMLRRKFDSMKGGHRVFLGSMTDLWHEDHDPGLLVALAEEIRLIGFRPSERSWPIVITLTKRADRLLAWQREHFPDGLPEWVWPGVTAGCQDAANARIPVLLQVRADGPRVVSVEPMTGPVDLKFCACETCCRGDHPGDCSTCAGWGDHSADDEDEADALGFASCEDCDGDGLCSLCGGSRRDARIGWVICGGESGAKARPSHPDWFRALREQCVAAGVPFFFKQWGEWAPGEDIEANGTDWVGMYEANAADGGVPQHTWRDAPIRETARCCGKGEISHDVGGDTVVLRVGKTAAGRLLDGREWNEIPNV
jgi:protein gp37